MTILQILSSSSYTMYNNEIAGLYGVEEAILLGALCGYQNSFGSGWFYREESKIADDTKLKIYTIRKAKQTLQNAGLLLIEKRGMPAKHYFKIDDAKLLSILLGDSISNESVSTTCGNENLTTCGNENLTTCGNENLTTRDKDFCTTYINNNKYSNKDNNTLTNVRGESRDVALTPSAKKSLLGNFKSSEILEKKVKGVEILAEDEVQKKKDSKDARMREQFSERFIKYCVEVEKINSPKFLEAVKGYLFTTAHKYGFKMSEQQMQCFFKVLQGWNKEYGMGVLLQVIEKATAAGDKIQDYMFREFNRTNKRRGNAPMDFNNKGLSSPEEEEMEKELQYSKDTISGVF